MKETLLKTKLNIPPLRPSLVPRLRLIEKLNAGLHLDHDTGLPQPTNRKLTLISAPPGFGKTTLASSWIHQLNQPTAWLSLDEGDNELNRFIHYLIVTFQEIYGELGETAYTLLQSPQPPPFDTLLTILINDLADLSGQVILVLDDYHVIQNLDIHKAITFLIDNQPPQLHLVIIGREDPVLPLHRLRGSGQMAGIYAHDLRFTKDEATLFLKKTMGLNLRPDEITVLEQRTEGWVAGLQLAALSLQDLANTHEFVTSFAGDDRYITDYLISEVIERQPIQIQDFLLKTAILDRFSAPLCDAILKAESRGLDSEDQGRWIGGWGENPSSQAIIEGLDQRNLFIIPLDNKREWYRYHHLFGEFLRLRLGQQPASEITDLHQRAAVWYENNGLLAEAIAHALAGEDFQRAGRLIEQNALPTIFGHAHWSTLFKWMEALPKEMVQARPHLNLEYAWALFTTGRWEAAQNLLEEMEPAFDAAEQTLDMKELRGESAALAALVAYAHGDVQRCTEQARQALLLLPEDNLTLRCVALLSVGESAMVLEDAPEARRSLHEAVDMALAAGNISIALFALGDLARLEMTEGYLQRAVELYQRARLLGTVGGSTILGPTGVACIQMGEVLREWNDLQQAELVLREGLNLCRGLTGLPNIVLEGQVNLARVMLANGDEQLAAETMMEVKRLLADLLGLGGDARPMISVALACRLRYWLALGELGTAARWLAANGISVDEAISPGNLAYHVALARVLIEQGRFTEAQKQLERLLKTMRERESPRLSIELLILKAQLYQAKGDRGEVETALIQALQLAEPEGYRRLFVDFGESITPLLERVAGRRSAPPIIKDILSIVRDERGITEKPPTSADRSPEAIGLIEPLKAQELQILRLMAAGLSNREIADELFLSANTIKVYASRIYGKLSVRRRGEAVARARELGLI